VTAARPGSAEGYLFGGTSANPIGRSRTPTPAWPGPVLDYPKLNLGEPGLF
jgi:hypothetical protein